MTASFRERLTSYAVLGPAAILLAFPFYWMIWTAFKTNNDLYNVQNPPFKYNATHVEPAEAAHMLPDWLPLGFANATYQHIRFLLIETQYPTWLRNTVLVGVIVVVITLALSLPAGYALARLSGRTGQSLGVGMFLVYLVPPTLLFLPLSYVIAHFPLGGQNGLQDSLWSLILVYPSFTVPFSTWLLMGFFKTIPKELEDAARVDGASRVTTLWRVVFPISIPGILTVVIFAFSLVLNDFVYALTFITRSTEKTVSTGVYTELIRGDVYFWQGLMAAALLPSIPLALLYNAFLNRFIAGFTGGAFR